MTPDIFDFWSEVRIGETVHPADRMRLSQFNHNFDLSCLSGSWRGPLRTAPVVLLFLAPGWSPQGSVMAKQEIYIERNARMRAGYEPLPEREETNPGWIWAARRTKVFGPWEELRPQVAILNIVPYHSPGRFKDGRAIKMLPSCQMTLAWARAVLFPQARRGDKVVVCLRAARRWGLKRGTQEGQLYAPKTVPSGYMEHGPMREKIIATVRKAIGS